MHITWYVITKHWITPAVWVWVCYKGCAPYYMPYQVTAYLKCKLPSTSLFSMLPAVSFGKLTTLAFPQTSVFPHHLILKICFLDPAGKSHAGIHYACASAIHCSLDILFPPDAHYNTLLELWQCIPNLVLKLWGTYVQEHSWNNIVWINFLL